MNDTLEQTTTPEPSGSSPPSESSTSDRARASLGIPEDASDKALRATIDRAMQKEKAATKEAAKPSVKAGDTLSAAEATVRGQFKAERVAREKEADRTGIVSESWRRGLSGGVQDTMELALARAKAREADDAGRRMPADGKRDMDATMRAVEEWSKLPEDEQRALKGASDLVAQRRADAAKLGISEAEMDANAAREAAISPIVERATQLGLSQQDVARFMQTMQTDPARAQAALRNFVERTGAGARHQQAASAAREQALSRAVVSHIDGFARARPDFDTLQPQMMHALQSGAVQRTGNVVADLASAYRAVGGRYA